MNTLYFPILLFTNTAPTPQQLPVFLCLKVSPQQATFAVHSPQRFREIVQETLQKGVCRKLSHFFFPPGVTTCIAQTMILSPELCEKFTALVNTATPEVVAMFEVDISTQPFLTSKKA